MPHTYPFHAADEAERPPAHRVHHNNSACPAGRRIHRKILGDKGYRLCDDCKEMNRLGH